MKLLAAGVLVVAGFAAGNAAPKLKYPWAGEKLNEPCGKTVLEWKLATGSIRQDKSIPINKSFMLTGLTATPKPAGLVAQAEVRIRPGYKLRRGDPGWAKECQDACETIFYMVQERFGEGRGYEDKLFRYWSNLAIGLRVDGKPAMEAIEGKFTLVKP